MGIAGGIKMARKLKLTMETSKPKINRYYCFVEDEKVIQKDGGETGKWEGDIKDFGAKVSFKAGGDKKAEYKVTITIDGDKFMESTSQIDEDGYHAYEIRF
jgi:hypothetical protein